MSRIVAGTLKGRQLKVPSQGTRPTSSRTREAMFSTLDAWNVLADAYVLDLYAGSGALAFESLSRGASQAVLVEKSRPSCELIKQNARTLGVGPYTKIFNTPVAKYLQTSVAGSHTGAGSQTDAVGQKISLVPFDLIFIDPPYDLPRVELTQNLQAIAQGLLAPSGVIIVEYAKRNGPIDVPPTLATISQKHYGETSVQYLELAGITD